MEPGRYTFADTTPDASGSGTASQHSGFRELVEKAELSEEAGLDPERVFQDFATLDLLSSGRAEIMAGRGSFIEFFPLLGTRVAPLVRAGLAARYRLLAFRRRDTFSAPAEHREQPSEIVTMRVVSCVVGGLLAASVLSSTAIAQNPAAPPAAGQQPAAPMSFFITSVGKGDGANYGGLAGADAYCAQLAAASGTAVAAGRAWRAYLSAVGPDGKPIHARDRIGAGPWHNAKGALIAANAADLHGDIIRDRNQINKLNAITEKGQTVNGVGDTPNIHDILTGSDTEGRALPGTYDTTCSNWTSNSATGSAMVGHHDRTGGGSTSWNSAHPSRGCGQQNLVSTGGAGLLYCFAAN